MEVNSNTITETITSSSSCSTDLLTINSITSNPVYKGTTATFTLTGMDFQSGFTAKLINELGTQYDVTSIQFVSSTSVKVTVYLGSGTTTNTQYIKVINPDSQSAQIGFTAQGG